MFTSSDFNTLIKINSLAHAAPDRMPSLFSCDHDDEP